MAEQCTTGLSGKLTREIRERGPISIARYMSACLLDPEFGYYCTAPVFGREGDFITAPEISQMFGELIGLWAAVVWRTMGAPDKFNLVELGPGRGTMMADALRALHTVPGAKEAVRVHLIEESAGLIEIQRATLAALPGTDAETEVIWHSDIAKLPVTDRPTIILANEFLDTLPIRQFVKSGSSWYERLVGLDDNGQLHFVLGDPAAEISLPEANEGEFFEIREIPENLLPTLDNNNSSPVAALFIDYGHIRSAPGDSFQAVQNHQYCDPLKSPGLADLTAHVDFDAFAQTMSGRGYLPGPPSTQAEFLVGLGIIERTERLMERASASERNQLETAVARLISPDAMGAKFKVIGLRSPDCPPPPEFSTMT